MFLENNLSSPFNHEVNRHLKLIRKEVDDTVLSELNKQKLSLINHATGKAVGFKFEEGDRVRIRVNNVRKSGNRFGQCGEILEMLDHGSIKIRLRDGRIFWRHRKDLKKVSSSPHRYNLRPRPEINYRD